MDLGHVDCPARGARRECIRRHTPPSLNETEQRDLTTLSSHWESVNHLRNCEFNQVRVSIK
jgi:hypothetical protein